MTVRNQLEWVTCPTCLASFTRPPGRGRPARYCSPVCRRVVEYELARVQGLLRRAQQRLQDAGLEVALARRYGREEAEQRQAFWRGEVERQGAELRRLLEASESPVTVLRGSAA